MKAWILQVDRKGNTTIPKPLLEKLKTYAPCDIIITQTDLGSFTVKVVEKGSEEVTPLQETHSAFKDENRKMALEYSSELLRHGKLTEESTITVGDILETYGFIKDAKAIYSTYLSLDPENMAIADRLEKLEHAKNGPEA